MLEKDLDSVPHHMKKMFLCRIWGLDLRLPHNSVIFEDAAKLHHATTEVEKCTSAVARVAVVGYKHEHLFFPNHGYQQKSSGTSIQQSIL